MSGASPFWLAIQAGDIAAVKGLIGEDRSLLHKRADSGHTPLRMACDCGHRPLAEALLEHGVEMDAFDACAFGDAARVAALLDNEPGLVSEHSHDGWTLLHLACFFGSQELLDLLLERDASVTSVSLNPTRNTPLHAALVGTASTPMIVSLLAKGADVNALASAGATPLHLAANRGDLELVELLSVRGAKSVRMDNGQTPAAIARDRGFPDLADSLEVG